MFSYQVVCIVTWKTASNLSVSFKTIYCSLISHKTMFLMIIYFIISKIEHCPILLSLLFSLAKGYFKDCLIGDIAKNGKHSDISLR